MMWSMRPSMRGLLSATAMSDTDSTIFCSIFQPSSVWAISRPLKRTVTLALWPSSRNRRTCFTLKSKSCFSVLGPIFTSFTEIVVCFLRASFSRRACGGPGGDPGGEGGDDTIQGDGAAVLARARAQADRPLLGLAAAHHEHV